MNLDALIKLALNDKHFARKYIYWVYTRKRQPDLGWLMSILEEALGVDFVKAAAIKYAEEQGA